MDRRPTVARICGLRPPRPSTRWRRVWTSSTRRRSSMARSAAMCGFPSSGRVSRASVPLGSIPLRSGRYEARPSRQGERRAPDLHVRGPARADPGRPAGVDARCPGRQRTHGRTSACGRLHGLLPRGARERFLATLADATPPAFSVLDHREHALAPDPLPPFASSRRLLRSFGVGLVHGLAGSAAIALLVLSAIPAPLWATLYLVIFCVGTIVGMDLLRLRSPRRWSSRRRGCPHCTSGSSPVQDC